MWGEFVAIISHPAVQHLSILTGVVALSFNIYKERRVRQNELYNATDDRYLTFLKLSLDNIDQDIFDISDFEIAEAAVECKLSQRTLKKELILFSILIKTCERAFLMFHENRCSTYHRQQWQGWEDYIKDYCGRKNFQRAWCIIGGQFDKKFSEKITGFMKSQGIVCPDKPSKRADSATSSQ